MDPQPESRNTPNRAGGILARFAQIAVFLLVQALLLFLVSGNGTWLWAWLYVGINIASITVNGFFLFRVNPDIIAERGRARPEQKWDKIFAVLWTLCMFLLLPLVAALDARNGWSGGLSMVWNIAGALLLASGLGFGGWAIVSNAFFSTVVRIQTERGHTVCRTGPYRFIRHPGYAGFSVQALGTALVLGSLWSLAPAVCSIVLVVIRTSFEDRMLHKDLAGYTEYAAEVRYRLIPGVW